MRVYFCDGGGCCSEEHELVIMERGDGIRVLQTVALGEEFLVGWRDGRRLLERLFQGEDGGVVGEGDCQSLAAETHL